MKSHITFRSTSFPSDPGEEESINPGCYGKRLADHLGSGLATRGWVVQSIYAEDWGWELRLQHNAFGLFVGCGHSADHQDSFLCFIEQHRPYVRRWFRKVSTVAVVTRLFDDLLHALSTAPDVRQLETFSYSEFISPLPG